MNARDFIDGEAREKAIHDTSAHLLVEAGAGTGKTSVLVSKIIYLLKTGTVKINEIAAITFTESAAHELRERIETELNKEFNLNSDNQNLSSALHELPAATITTIHGFANLVLRKYGYTIGIPSGFSVIDESIAKYRLKSKLLRVLYKAVESEDAKNILMATQALGITNYHLNELWSLSNEKFYAATKSDQIRFDSKFQYDIINSIIPQLYEIKDLLEKCKTYYCKQKNDKLFLLLERLVSWQRLLPLSPTLPQLIEWLLLITDQKTTKTGNKVNWLGTDIADVRDCIQKIFNLRKNILQYIIDLILPLLAFWFADEAGKLSLERKLSGELRFQDLLVYCYELLMNSIEVRNNITSQYKYILVDEFQDTDQLQLAILKLLSELPENSQGSKLFYVGDPKQSIYRFRGADIDLYREVRHTIAGDSPLQLVTNFRSQPEILETVNKIFTHLIQANGDISTELGQEDFYDMPTIVSQEDANKTTFASHKTNVLTSGEKFQPLVAARSSTESKVVFLKQSFDGDATASERRQAESAAIVAVIEEAVFSPWLVSAENSQKPASFGDVAIIIPRRTGLYELRMALEKARIPYQLPSSDLIFSNQFVQDMIACIKAIIMPYREYYICSALRSIVFGCSDVDLMKYKSEGGTWQLNKQQTVHFSRDQLIQVSNDATDHMQLHGVSSYQKVLSAIKDIYYFNSIYKEYGIIAMLAKLVDKSNIYTLGKISKFSYESQITLDYIINRVITYAKDKNLSSQDLLDFLEAEKENYPRAELFEDSDIARDSVKIVTVHASKGLEYPIVIMAELGAVTSPREKPNIICDDYHYLSKESIHIRINDQIKTSRYDEATDKYERLERAEMYRLCYVAATRARDHLVVSLAYKPSVSGKLSLAETIYNIVESDEYLLNRVKNFDFNTNSVRKNLVDMNSLKVKREINLPGKKSSAEYGFMNDISITDWKDNIKNYQKEKLLSNIVSINFLESTIAKCPPDLLKKLLISEKVEKIINFRNATITEFEDDVFMNYADAQQIYKLISYFITEKELNKDKLIAKNTFYFNNFLEKNINLAYKIYEYNLLTYLSDSNQILKNIDIIFNTQNTTFEGTIDILIKDKKDLTILDSLQLLKADKNRFLANNLRKETDLILSYFRLGLYSLAISSLGYILQDCLLIYPVSVSSCALQLVPTDKAIEVFQELIPTINEVLCYAS